MALARIPTSIIRIPDTSTQSECLKYFIGQGYNQEDSIYSKLIRSSNLSIFSGRCFNIIVMVKISVNMTLFRGTVDSA